jgi:hypothetical protein
MALPRLPRAAVCLTAVLVAKAGNGPAQATSSAVHILLVRAARDIAERGS